MNYRKIWESHYGDIPKDDQGRSFDIHHIDGDRSNNDIGNLIALSIEDHYKIHLAQNDNAAVAAISQRMGQPLYGWSHSEETRLKISKSKTGSTHSEETKNKMSQSRMGKTHSDEAKQKMRKPKKSTIKYKGPTTQEHKDKIKASMTGVKHTPERIANISRGRKGIVPSHNLEVQTCPHCGTQANGFGYTRWHGNKCRQKEVVYG
jgi:hypothetical protein